MSWINWIMNPTFEFGDLSDWEIILLGYLKIFIIFAGALLPLLPIISLYFAINLYKHKKTLQKRQITTQTAKIIQFPQNPEKWKKTKKVINHH